MNFPSLQLPKVGRARRKSYGGGGASPGAPSLPLYNIPDNDRPIDFLQEQQLMKERRRQMRRGSMPARPWDVSALAMPLLESAEHRQQQLLPQQQQQQQQKDGTATTLTDSTNPGYTNR
ncbi:uncharacterized protein LOC143294150 [Babylonia areolata]|uniref:uncharacterized protein LOC143294150 n=1 Tax=Babylonia areolata TaxID=304850 RepID=UPI003FD2957B